MSIITKQEKQTPSLTVSNTTGTVIGYTSSNSLGFSTSGYSVAIKVATKIDITDLKVIQYDFETKNMKLFYSNTFTPISLTNVEASDYHYYYNLLEQRNLNNKITNNL